MVVLTHDIEEHNLKSGDVGTVVHCYDDKSGFEVEFVTAERKTMAVLTLPTDALRRFENSEILHTRDITLLVA